METPVPKWLRITMYAIASAVGLGGAILGYGKPATMGVAIATMLAIEGANYLVQRRQP